MGDHGPSGVPFTYVFLAADEGRAPESQLFEGHSDDALRAMFKAYFCQHGCTDGQRAALQQSLLERVKEKEGGDVSQQLLADVTADEGAFEIIPVVMPSIRNGFVATSLYIDDKGRFKELPVNSRASRLAQRDVRGDAFLLSNHDDPALEEWRRVDTSLPRYEELYASPPVALDASNSKQMMSAGGMREDDSKLTPPEDAAAALVAKAEGNTLFGSGDLAGAVAKYSDAIDKTKYRTDRLDNTAAIIEMRKTCFLNRSLCLFKLEQWAASEADAAAVLSGFDQTSVKAWYRRAWAQCKQAEFAEARMSLSACSELGLVATDVALLQAEIERDEVAFNARQRGKYKGMFS
jgi:hypothetical protein